MNLLWNCKTISKKNMKSKLISTHDTECDKLSITHLYKDDKVISVLVSVKNKTIKLPKGFARRRTEEIIKKVCFIIKAGIG